MPTESRLRLPPDAKPIELHGEFVSLRTAADGGSTDGRPTDQAPAVEGPAVERLVSGAMAAPLGLPPLARCFTEDDRVAVALGQGVPRVDAVLRGLLVGLAEARINADQVTIVTTGGEPTLAAGLAEAVEAGLRIVAHDPADEENLCFAGVDERDEPLRINRQLFEADVLLPVTCAHAPGHPAANGPFGDLFPAFGDAPTIKRLSQGLNRDDHRDDAERARWVLGVMISLQVSPGPGGGVAAVFAGESQRVEQEATRHAGRLWAATADEPASLVVVSLGAEPSRQAWRTLTNALETADALTTPDAAVAVLTQLATPPPDALIELAEADTADAALHRLQSRRDPDLPLARAVAAALERGPLYLMSGLASDDVESLGMAPLSGVDELRRLVAGRPSVLLLGDAEHVVATVRGDCVRGEAITA